MRKNSVAVLAFDGISPFHLSVPCLVFGEDRREAGIPAFDLRLCAHERGPLRSLAGLRLSVPYGLEGLRGAETVIVPSWREPAEPPKQAVLDALREAHAQGAHIVGLCLGAFVLADAGLLDGRAATTHWHYADLFRQRFPSVRLDPDVLYVEDGRLLTSAGTAAGIDACLHLVRRNVGAEVATRLARRIVVPPHRQGNQAQYIERPLQEERRKDRIGEAMAWAMRRLHEPLDLDTLAARAAMSRRHFTRRFRETNGISVARWLAEQRLAKAQRLLETTDRPLERIASDAGYGSLPSLRQHFIESLATTPARYRREFRGGA